MKLQYLMTDEIASQLMALLETVTKHHISTESTETLFDHRRNVVTFTLKNEGVLVEFVGGRSMLDEIREKVLELNAVTTMLEDELINAYQIDEKIRQFEFDRLEDVLITSIGMIITRIDPIDGIIDKLVDEKINNAGGQS